MDLSHFKTRRRTRIPTVQETVSTPKTIKAIVRGSAGRAKSTFLLMYLASPMERVEIIRRGVPAEGVVETCNAMGVAAERLYEFLKISRATVSKKIAQKSVLSPDMSERLLGLQKLIGQVEVMVAESGNPEGFNAAKWVAEWLASPLPALGGQKPGSLMDTVEGQELVSRLLAQMQSGAYA